MGAGSFVQEMGKTEKGRGHGRGKLLLCTPPFSIVPSFYVNELACRLKLALVGTWADPPEPVV